MVVRIGAVLIFWLGCVAAQAQQLQQPIAPGQEDAAAAQAMARQYVVRAQTRIPLVLVNSVSTKTSEPGDQVYLQTSFPIFTNGRIVIAEGSYVTGTITQVKRPGRIRGRGELYVRFDTLSLRNGVTRDFRGTVSATDGSQTSMTEKEGTIVGEATKGEDTATVSGGAAQGTSTGAIIGAVEGNWGKGAAIGASVGAAAGMIAVLLTRGSEVLLLRGSSLEMELDRDLLFFGDEIDFAQSAPVPALPQLQPLPPAQTGSPLGRGNQFPFPRF